ncbi:hypothetical protein SpCBS45565_g06626 [Spizellomyces sp. 'palustris']|nr:hypothetical protein SpCBS45565_g06626 [Spizellomyces sp. 'palustris']
MHGPNVHVPTISHCKPVCSKQGVVGEDILSCYPGHHVKTLRLGPLKGFKSRIDNIFVNDFTRCLSFDGSITHLVWLDLSDCYLVTDTAFINLISSSPYLVHLNVSGWSGLSDTAIKHIGECTRLRTLILGVIFENCRAVGDAVRGSRRTLEVFCVDSGVDWVCGKIVLDEMALTTLSVARIPLCNEGLEKVLRCGRLRELCLTKQESLPCLARLGEWCTKLVTVNLAQTKFPPSTLASLKTCSSALQTLNLSFCSTLTDADLEPLVRDLPHLLSLKVDGCILLTDAPIITLLHHCPFLTDLHFKGTNITSTTLNAIVNAPCANQLVHLSVKDCVGIHADTLLSPGFARLSRLESFDVSGLDVTHVHIEVLARALPRLRVLRIVGCDGVPIDFAREFKECNALGEKIALVDVYGV